MSSPFYTCLTTLSHIKSTIHMLWSNPMVISLKAWEYEYFTSQYWVNQVTIEVFPYLGLTSTVIAPSELLVIIAHILHIYIPNKIVKRSRAHPQFSARCTSLFHFWPSASPLPASKRNSFLPTQLPVYKALWSGLNLTFHNRYCVITLLCGSSETDLAKRYAQPYGQFLFHIFIASSVESSMMYSYDA